MPLTVRAEAGVFLMLAFGICVGILILFAEHFVFKYCLPGLRRKGKDSYWKTPNLMFFSQVRGDWRGVLVFSKRLINFCFYY